MPIQTKGSIDGCYLISEAAGSLEVSQEVITHFYFKTYPQSAGVILTQNN